MAIAPKILGHAPIKIQGPFFAHLASLFRQFIWGKNRCRLSIKMLQRPKTDGGMALPDMHLYYLAAQLSQIRTLKNAQPEDALYQLWQCLLKTDLPPFYAILALNLYRTKQMISNYFLVESQKLCLQWSLQLVQPAVLELQTPLWSNCKLAPLDKLSTPKEWIQAGVWSIGQVWSDNGMVPFNELRQTYSLPNSQWLIYHKVRAALYRLNKSKRLQFGTSSIMEQLISAGSDWRSRGPPGCEPRGPRFELPLDPKWYISGIDPPHQLTHPAKKILHKILFQARKLIAQLWKSQLPPLYADWEKSVQNMCNVEQLGETITLTKI
ncbi:hypothetical protein XELAEV_18007755mg [Xenopus laevis]|uniref:Uncharacterized protein n=1 Tax=Xenopus laevis TaxID=8355 RepID=A0A974E2J9_XENLA|nr:hypothetical protein XELAEV_18007755mg [Xenopus laevis]